MKRTLIVVLLTLALVGAAYFQRDSSTEQGPKAPSIDPASSKPMVRHDELPQTAPETKTELVPTPFTEARAQPDVKVVVSMVGASTATASIDFDRYVALTFAALASQKSDSLTKSMFKSQYDLTDEEFEAVAQYAVAALRLDGEFQARERTNLCASPESIASLYDFGVALNEQVKRISDYQGELGRQAEASLGPALFGKINNRVLNEPRREVSSADFPTVFAAQNRVLEEEVARFCNPNE